MQTAAVQNLKQNTERRSDIGLCDIHCHLLPGLDDGPRSIAEAVEMCALAADDGITTIVATPHHNHRWCLDEQEAAETLGALRLALKASGVPVEIEMGAEIAATWSTAGLATVEKHLTIGGLGKMILLEPPHDFMPVWMANLIFELRVRGLGVIIAHPERNPDVQDDPNQLLPLVSSGVMLQVTAGSLLGEFGREARRCAISLLKMNMVHVIATDAHSASHRAPRLSAAMRMAARIIGDDARALVSRNPRALLAGGYFELPEPRPLKKLFGLFR